MNPVPFSWMLLAIGIAFAGGGVSGSYLTYSLNRVGELTRQIGVHQLNEKRIRTVLEMDEKFDEENEDADKRAEKVLDALNEKIRARPVALDDDSECVSADIMHGIGSIN